MVVLLKIDILKRKLIKEKMSITHQAIVDYISSLNVTIDSFFVEYFHFLVCRLNEFTSKMGLENLQTFLSYRRAHNRWTSGNKNAYETLLKFFQVEGLTEFQKAQHEIEVQLIEASILSFKKSKMISLEEINRWVAPFFTPASFNRQVEENITMCSSSGCYHCLKGQIEHCPNQKAKMGKVGTRDRLRMKLEKKKSLNPSC